MNAEIALKLIATDKLSVDQMLDVGKIADDWHVWEAIVLRLEE